VGDKIVTTTPDSSNKEDDDDTTQGESANAAGGVCRSTSPVDKDSENTAPPSTPKRAHNEAFVETTNSAPRSKRRTAAGKGSSNSK
jgi:hypothetical protein